jgi:hypothetical protein
MKTKFILGLSMGMMVIAQIGSDQGIFTGMAGGETFAFNGAADGGWSSFGVAAAQQGLAAVGNDRASASSISSSDADFTWPSPDNSDNSPIDAMAGNDPVSAVPTPLISPSVPEPGTGGLLAIGGATLTAGALSRRKQAA